MKKTVFFFLCAIQLYGQTPTDGFLVEKKNAYVGLTYMNESWSSYWEADKLRTNENIGTLIRQTVSLSANYGLTNNLNFIVAIPYVSVRATQGTLASQAGLQDFSGYLKYRVSELIEEKEQFSVFLMGGVSFPLQRYVNDYVPLNLGQNNNTATFRVLLRYLRASGFTMTLSGQYQYMGDTEIQRNTYYTNTLVYSNKVKIFDMFGYFFKIGYFSKRFSVEGIIEQVYCLDGYDIRPNDMPFLNNRSLFGRMGGYVSYRVPFMDNLQVKLNAEWMYYGKNTGKTALYTIGVFKTIEL